MHEQVLTNLAISTYKSQISVVYIMLQLQPLADESMKSNPWKAGWFSSCEVKIHINKIDAGNKNA